MVEQGMNKNDQIEEIYKVIKEIEDKNDITQRDIASRLGYSLGKVNYLIKALTNMGIIKLQNFKKSDNKLGYKYILTSEGIKEKYKITKQFLNRKETEYEKMQVEIDKLRKEVKSFK
ncbi:MarR family EPS-associated transcriptional regulator [Spirochaetota bacterium]